MDKRQEDFLKNSNPVSIAQVYFLMKNIEEKRKEIKSIIHPNFESFYEYIKRFNNYPEVEVIQMLQEKTASFKYKDGRNGLTDYQLTCIMNLNPKDVNELKSILPDTKNVNDSDLRKLLDILDKHRKIDL